MGKLEGEEAVRLEQRGESGREPNEIGDVRVHVVAGDQVGTSIGGSQLLAGLGAEEPDFGTNPLRLGDFSDVGRRLDAENRNTACHEVLQEVSVVAGDLSDKTVPIEPEALDHR